jgi:pSer/pThr/pTyr-binding forkhead associated (FHA) protein
VIDGRLFGLALAERPVTWDGRPRNSGWIAGDDGMTFGPFRLSIPEGIAPNGAADLTNPLVTAAGHVPPLILNYHGGGRAFRGTVNRPLTLVGSSPVCKFRIRADQVSSVHCGLVRCASGVWAVDLGGRGGFLLNGVSHRVALLGEGDIYEFGGLIFRTSYGAPREEHLPPVPVVESVSLPPTERRPVPIVVRAEAGERREPVERLMAPIIDHFATIQQQTFRQFEDLLVGVIGKFGAMFQQQQEFVREEMKRFDALTVEITRLNESLAALPREPVVEGEALTVPEAEAVTDPAPEVSAPPASGQEVRAGGEAVIEHAPRHAVTDDRPMPVEEPGALTNPSDTQSRAESANGKPAADTELHVWLQSRIAELYQQRNTLWHRLLGLIRNEPSSPK